MSLSTMLAPVSAKVILVLGLALLASWAALGVSVYFNVKQQQGIWTAHGKQLGERKLATVSAERDGLKLTAARNEAIASTKAVDTTELLADLRDIAEAARPVRVVYKQAAANAPLAANCAPGATRQGAVNDYLGPRIAAPPAAAAGGKP